MTGLGIATLSGGTASIPEAELAQLASGLRGPLLRPDSPGYDEARVVFNGMFDRRPAAIVRASGTADVADAVNFARKHHLLMAIRAGGHSLPGHSTCEGGFMLDLSAMRGVQVDLKAKTVRVQGGATWADVDRETQLHGLATPGGVVSNTGVAGLTLNGGLGYLRSKYGFSCDALVSAEVVTADGQVLTASANENADLFWALRGGGGNFGVVTSFEFQLYPVGPLVATAITFYDPADARAILRGWRDYMAAAPDEVTSNAVFWTGAVSPHMPEPVHGKDILITVGVYLGPAGEGDRVMQPLRELGTPIFDMSGTMPYRVLQSAFDFFFPVDGTVSAYFKSLYLAGITEEAIEVIIAAAASRPSKSSLVNIPHLGRGVRDVPVEATAFAGRGAPYMVSFDSIWPSDAGDAPNVAWARDGWAKMQPSSTGATYLNFAGEEEGAGGAGLVRSAFAANYERLVDIKTRYDPTNFFRLNQNIPPRGQEARTK
jgi:FAD/FMN-containing dehydrogenase